MNKDLNIQKLIDQTYYKLINISEIEAYISGGYIDLIINKDNSIYADEIINKLFEKITNTIKVSISRNDIEFIKYKSFCFNNPSDEIIKDCFDIVNSFIENKKSSNETNLLNSINS